MEYKSLQSFTKAIEGRKVSGIFAVHGNIDSYFDRSHPGSFNKTIVERVATGKVKHLWSHDLGDFWMGTAPKAPIAVVREVKELPREELPSDVLMMAPEATGGVEVTREYLDTERGNEVLKGIQAGAITEMSYGYDPVKFDFEEIEDKRVRNLREIRLWETSDVLWGANEATVASSKWLPPVDVVLKALERYMTSMKAGARHSTADTELINQIHKMVVDLGATSCKGIVGEEDDEEEDAEEEEGDEKSRAGIVMIPLTLLKGRLDYLDLISSSNR